MKKLTVILTAIVMLIFSGCNKFSGSAKEIEAEKVKIAGEWTVISVNCLDVLAEKDGQRRTFHYRMPAGYHGSVYTTRAMCSRVRPGWIVYVESANQYHFFPPTEFIAKKRK